MDNRNDGNDTNNGTPETGGRTVRQLALMLVGIIFGCAAAIVTLRAGNAIGVPLLMLAGIFTGFFGSTKKRLGLVANHRRLIFDLICTLAAYTILFVFIVPNPPELAALPATSTEYWLRASLFFFEILTVFAGGTLIGQLIRSR